MDKNITTNLIASGIAIVAYVLLIGLKRYGIVKVKAWTSHTKLEWDDIILETINQTRQWFLIIAALYIGFQYSPADDKFSPHADKVFILALMLQLVIWANYFLNELIDIILKKKAAKNPGIMGAQALVKTVVKFLAFSLILLTTLKSLGVDVGAALTGLGVGGIIIGLAIQPALSDLMGSLSLNLDRPVEVGDFIATGEWQGTVQKIGLKSTRLTSNSGEQIIIANNDLLSSRVRNYKRMKERRATFSFNLSIENDSEKLTQALEIIKETIKAHDSVRLGGSYLTDLTLYTYTTETVYWITSPDYDLFRRVHQEILLTIVKKFKNADIKLTLSPVPAPATPSP